MFNQSIDFITYPIKVVDAIRSITLSIMLIIDSDNGFQFFNNGIEFLASHVHVFTFHFRVLLSTKIKFGKWISFCFSSSFFVRTKKKCILIFGFIFHNYQTMQFQSDCENIDLSGCVTTGEQFIIQYECKMHWAKMGLTFLIASREIVKTRLLIALLFLIFFSLSTFLFVLFYYNILVYI